jgi:hypothetical protein
VHFDRHFELTFGSHGRGDTSREPNETEGAANVEIGLLNRRLK